MRQNLLFLLLAFLGVFGFAQEKAPALHISSYDTEDPVHIDKETTYVVEVRNEGTAPCTDIQCENYIPSQMEFVEAQGTASYKWNKEKHCVVFSEHPVLQPGSKMTYKIRCKAVNLGFAKNKAMIRCQGISEPLAEEEGTTLCKSDLARVPALHFSGYDTEDPVKVGGETCYVVEMRNEGTSPCTNLKFRDRIPAGMEFLDAKGPTPHKWDEEKRMVIFTPHPILQPGEKLTFMIRCKAIESGFSRNTAIALFDQFGPEIVDEESSTICR